MKNFKSSWILGAVFAIASIIILSVVAMQKLMNPRQNNEIEKGDFAGISSATMVHKINGKLRNLEDLTSKELKFKKSNPQYKWHKEN